MRDGRRGEGKEKGVEKVDRSIKTIKINLSKYIDDIK